MQERSLSVFVENWKIYHDHLKEALAPLTAEQLALCAAPNVRSIGLNAQHIIAARAWWFKVFMGEGGDDMLDYRTWDDAGQPDRSTAKLLSGLDATWNMMADRLSRWTAEDMAVTFPHTWRGDHYDLSRSWVVWHVLEHDLHHGGEISLTMGMHGLQAPDI